LAAVNAAARLEHAGTELVHDLRESRPPRLDQLVPRSVGIEHRAATLAQHRGHRGFATGDAPGQSGAQHRSRRRRAGATPGPAAGARPSPYWTSAWRW